MQFFITAHTNIRAVQAIRLDRMELAAIILAANRDDCIYWANILGVLAARPLKRKSQKKPDVTSKFSKGRHD